MQQVVEFALFLLCCWSSGWNGNCRFYFNFSLTTGIKKHSKNLMMAKSKKNIIETLVLQVLTDMKICHEEFINFEGES